MNEIVFTDDKLVLSYENTKTIELDIDFMAFIAIICLYRHISM
jgi:hypothetical protein